MILKVGSEIFGKEDSVGLAQVSDRLCFLRCLLAPQEMKSQTFRLHFHPNRPTAKFWSHLRFPVSLGDVETL